MIPFQYPNHYQTVEFCTGYLDSLDKQKLFFLSQWYCNNERLLFNLHSFCSIGSSLTPISYSPISRKSVIALSQSSTRRINHSSGSDSLLMPADAMPWKPELIYAYTVRTASFMSLALRLSVHRSWKMASPMDCGSIQVGSCRVKSLEPPPDADTARSMATVLVLLQCESACKTQQHGSFLNRENPQYVLNYFMVLCAISQNEIKSKNKSDMIVECLNACNKLYLSQNGCLHECIYDILLQCQRVITMLD